jgi:transposase-like protein|tara:strand:- start:1924 stop:2178 length:255 start_codon:yes stop_codon:yes gene_type:complete
MKPNPKQVPLDFDPVAEVARLKAQTKFLRKRNYSQRKSALDNYHGEIIQLLRNGSTATEVHRWLRELEVTISLSTVTRWIKKHG